MHVTFTYVDFRAIFAVRARELIIISVIECKEVIPYQNEKQCHRHAAHKDGVIEVVHLSILLN